MKTTAFADALILFTTVGPEFKLILYFYSWPKSVSTPVSIILLSWVIGCAWNHPIIHYTLPLLDTTPLLQFIM